MTTTGGFPPFITARLNFHFHHFPFLLKTEQAWSGSKNYPSIFDRFTLCIHYCLGFIKWDVIYNAVFPLYMAEYLPYLEQCLHGQGHFLIPTQFPKQQAALVLQSSQHFNSQGAPIQSSLITDYPWSPRWEPSQMAERIFDFLVDESLNFKRYSTEA